MYAGLVEAEAGTAFKATLRGSVPHLLRLVGGRLCRQLGGLSGEPDCVDTSAPIALANTVPVLSAETAASRACARECVDCGGVSRHSCVWTLGVVNSPRHYFSRGNGVGWNGAYVQASSLIDHREVVAASICMTATTGGLRTERDGEKTMFWYRMYGVMWRYMSGTHVSVCQPVFEGGVAGWTGGGG